MPLGAANSPLSLQLKVPPVTRVCKVSASSWEQAGCPCQPREGDQIVCGEGAAQLVLGVMVLGERGIARGSGVRLALNPQKSPYLEKCSIRLLISPFALISLLVCAAAVLLSGREGEAEEGAGR